MNSNLFFQCKIGLFTASCIMETLASFAHTNLIARMGSTDNGSYDKGWLFARCGLQPDGTGIKESQQVMFVWGILYLKPLLIKLQHLS